MVVLHIWKIIVFHHLQSHVIIPIIILQPQIK